MVPAELSEEAVAFGIAGDPFPKELRGSVDPKHGVLIALRSVDALGRQGGDEFTVLLESVHGVADAQDHGLFDAVLQLAHVAGPVVP